MKNSFINQKISKNLQTQFQTQFKVNTKKFQADLKTLLVNVMNLSQDYDWIPLENNQGFFMVVCPVTPTSCEEYPLNKAYPESTHQTHVKLNEAYHKSQRLCTFLGLNTEGPGKPSKMDLIKFYKHMIEDIHQTQDAISVKTEEGIQEMPLNEAIEKF
ncbi:MAG: hypothetical protein VXY83_03480, partial [Pseudomonadota bacterium]|nr:hypothetical protein [Pseudomonadota bacterium]